jgi:hypothetical protein
MNRLLLLATGGTIAGCADDSATLNDYTAGVLGGDALLAAVPQLQDLATITVEQVANVDSADLLFEHWRALVARIRDAFAADPELAGVVITHGTNTLEETAWLLQLLIDDPRPVVLVGAMRPATALSADGPLNLLQAVQVALSPVARGYGVLVVMDGQIHGAQRVTKVATQGVGAFASPGSGPLGRVDDFGVHLPGEGILAGALRRARVTRAMAAGADRLRLCGARAADCSPHVSTPVFRAWCSPALVRVSCRRLSVRLFRLGQGSLPLMLRQPLWFWPRAQPFR